MRWVQELSQSMSWLGWLLAVQLKVERTAEEEADQLAGDSAPQLEVQPLQLAAEPVAASSRRCRQRSPDKRASAVGLLAGPAERG